MFRNILAGMAVLALTAGAAAQTQVTVQSKINVPVKYFGTYQMATGEWSHGGARVGTRVLYNSQSPGNYYSNVGNTSQTAADQEWIDEGILADENGALVTQMDGFDFGYCSTDLEPLGNQCSVGITFYDDYIPCSTPLSAATCAYLISGLPCSISGNIECWAVSIDLAGGAECTADPTSMFRTVSAVADPLGNVNGNFGWGFTPNPGAAGMNDTGPILSFPCPNPVSGCSSGSLQGNQNFFWWEDPTAVWTGCYWFGGVPWASFDMKMFGPEVNSYAYYSATCANIMGLTSTAAAAGSTVTWTASGIPGTSTGVFLLTGLSSADLAVGGGQCVLVGGAPSFPPLGPIPMAGGSVSVTIPAAAAGAAGYSQAVSVSGAPTAANVDGASNGLFHASL